MFFDDSRDGRLRTHKIFSIFVFVPSDTRLEGNVFSKLHSYLSVLFQSDVKSLT